MEYGYKGFKNEYKSRHVIVKYILRGHPGIEPDYCILGIELKGETHE